MVVSGDIKEYKAPDYFIIYFSQDKFDEFRLAIADLDDITNLKETKHFFDEELNNILDIINLLLQFPRLNYDLSILEPKKIKQLNHLPHNIIFLPHYLLEEIIKGHILKEDRRSIFIIDDEVYSSISSHPRLSSERCYSFTEIMKVDLKEIWSNLNDYNNGLNDLIEFLPYPKSELIPLIHFSDQIDKVDKKIFDINESNIDEISEYRWKQQGYLDGMERLVEKLEKGIEITENIKNEIFNSALKKAKFPVTITLPGQPKKIDRVTNNNGVPKNEEQAIRLLGIHNAISTNGVHMPLDILNEECFIELNQLENHCKGNINSRYIWRSLRKLGKMLAEHLGPHGVTTINRASSINIFSDFPFGLAILPNTNAPICCHKAISYKPLTPLTRMLQLEMKNNGIILLNKDILIKVLIIECLAKNDRIRKASDVIWEQFRESINPKHFNVVYLNVENTEDFLKVIKKHSDTVILIISAHGGITKENNLTYIQIGEKDNWTPLGNDFNSPPVVLFSACHVSPRGAGTVSISDLFVRNGALTVLSTLVPVDVTKNGLLMIRLFLYLSMTLDGHYDFKNISEVWSFVVSTNAINEIVDSTKSLKNWSLTLRADKTFPMKDFQHQDSVGRLRYTHVYSDSLKVMREIAERDGVLSKFSNALRDDNCYPESIFYQFIGYPELIFIDSKLKLKIKNTP